MKQKQLDVIKTLVKGVYLSHGFTEEQAEHIYNHKAYEEMRLSVYLSNATLSVYPEQGGWVENIPAELVKRLVNGDLELCGFNPSHTNGNGNWVEGSFIVKVKG